MMDEGYKHLITVILNLNHDRYKSYFNYFIVLHLGTLTAIGSDFATERTPLRPFLSTVGVVLSVAWLLVLYKVQRDIATVWKAIKNYEDSGAYSIKIHETSWKGWFSASRVMLIIPILFLAAYVYVIVLTI